MVSPSGSKLNACMMSLPMSARRKILAGTNDEISFALLPRPLLEDIFLPPTKKNSYGAFNGVSYANTSFAICAATSRVPPLVEGSLPAPSTCTPTTFHLAGHSTRSEERRVGEEC